MRTCTRFLLAAVGIAVVAAAGFAQPPRQPSGDAPKPAAKDRKPDQAAVDAIVNKMMAFDKNKDGKLTKDEITDERLLRLFDRADKNKDGVVTKEELVELATRMAADEAANGGRRGGFGPPGDGPGGRGPGGPGRGGFAAPPPGQILPSFLQERLKLTDDQKKQVEELQKDADAKLAKILTTEQMQQLKEMRNRRPGGFGPPGGGPGRRPGGGDAPPPAERP